jgi:hypothetical protein
VVGGHDDQSVAVLLGEVDRHLDGIVEGLDLLERLRRVVGVRPLVDQRPLDLEVEASAGSGLPAGEQADGLGGHLRKGGLLGLCRAGAVPLVLLDRQVPGAEQAEHLAMVRGLQVRLGGHRLRRRRAEDLVPLAAQCLLVRRVEASESSAQDDVRSAVASHLVGDRSHAQIGPGQRRAGHLGVLAAGS